jgi:hypothetical protein
VCKGNVGLLEQVPGLCGRGGVGALQFGVQMRGDFDVVC